MTVLRAHRYTKENAAGHLFIYLRTALREIRLYLAVRDFDTVRRVRA